MNCQYVNKSLNRRIFNIHSAILFYTILIFLFSPNIYSNEVTNVEWKNFDNYFRIVLILDDNVNYNIVNSLQDKKYFYINLRNVQKPYSPEEIPVNDKRLVSVKTQFFPDHEILRFVFYAREAVTYNITALQKPNRLVIDIADKEFTPSDIYRRKIVIIDPGHGDKSLGGRSTKKVGDNYIFEKDLVLSISKKLKKLFDKQTNITAYMARDTDKFLSLKERIDFAEANKGDIFISIHANDSRFHADTSARGIEFFFWSEEGSTDASVKYLEELNNDADLDIPGKENEKVYNLFKNMLTDKLEAETVESGKFCEILNNSFKESDYFKQYNRGVKRARFKVLQNYNMPAVLVETGFINNSRELKKLMDPEFQDEIAKHIFNAVNTYFAKEDQKFQPSSVKINSD